ncbi:OmpH family outer membrane protein [Mariniphaga sediminis]|jgi:outer membrane protein|uniref:OmpH family outer membrane protein n=1 Tax=Mariniphaga sediminis TaxID=1628158 RepID=A0A399D570_9BACT|nr:OmpH family outer membrane protein [Mariniphaga sediminis]RIH66799.1 OmpH family outer membrane protein [Mariniphaga sediminis]
MRNLMKLFVLLIFATATISATAQNLKFGHIDLQALVQLMPERATAETDFNNFQTELEDVLGEMQQNYQQKLAELEQLGEDASEVRRNAKITELQEIQQRVQNYQVTANQQLQQKQAELLQPVFDKAEKAIEEVAQEQGLLYVFDVGSRVVLYKSNQSVDLLPLVKQKLGIQ